MGNVFLSLPDILVADTRSLDHRKLAEDVKDMQKSWHTGFAVGSSKGFLLPSPAKCAFLSSMILVLSSNRKLEFFAISRKNLILGQSIQLLGSLIYFYLFYLFFIFMYLFLFFCHWRERISLLPVGLPLLQRAEHPSMNGHIAGALS